MNAWVLSMIMCSAVPATDGSYCTAKPLMYGVTREACRTELERWRSHPSKPRLECTNDPALTAQLTERDGPDPDQALIRMARPTF